MGWKFLHQSLKDASAGEVYEKTYSEVYLLDSINDFNSFLFACKKKNTLVIEPKGDGYVYFIVDSNTITKRQPMPGGKVQVELSIKLRHFSNIEELLAPWDLPAFSFHISSSVSEESASKFYPGDDDIWHSEDSDAFDFVNSAGVMLEGTATFATSQITISYAISALTFKKIQQWLWRLPGKINSDDPTICGMYFPPRTLKIESLNAEYSEVQKPGLVGTGTVGESTVVDMLYHYYRIDVTLTANPRTWNQSFLNVGTHVRKDGVLSRIWSWTDSETRKPKWGTYTDYRMANGVNGEALSEPVPLNVDGTGVTSLDDDGRLTMTYRHGSLYEPVPFKSIAFPSKDPIKWSYGG